MYIIACRAHFYHLLGLGQVGHPPRQISGSAGTLDWGPMWSGSQSTCHPQYTPSCPWFSQNGPLHPLGAPMPPISLLAPEYLESLPAPQIHPDTPKMAPTCLGAPWCPYTSSGPWVPRVPPSPQYTCDTPTPPKWPLHPLKPKCPLMPPLPLLDPEYLQSPAIPPIHPYTPINHIMPQHPYTP